MLAFICANISAAVGCCDASAAYWGNADAAAAAEPPPAAGYDGALGSGAGAGAGAGAGLVSPPENIDDTELERSEKKPICSRIRGALDVPAAPPTRWRLRAPQWRKHEHHRIAELSSGVQGRDTPRRTGDDPHARVLYRESMTTLLVVLALAVPGVAFADAAYTRKPTLNLVVKISDRTKPAAPKAQRPITADDAMHVQEVTQTYKKEQEAILEKLVTETPDDDPDKPDLMFRLAEQYAKQHRFWRLKSIEATMPPRR
jgi:hypothetical protein